MSIFPAVRPAVTPAVRGAFEQGSGGGAASIIAGLFAQGQQGFWLPFTDFASLTQDSAGTLPYTALEQPVGRVLDRSGRGNHASQPTSTARGVVSARVNLLQKTEDIGVSPWVAPGGLTLQAGARVSPTGDATMTLLTHSVTGTTQYLQQVFACPASTDLKMRVALAKNSASTMQVKVYNGGISVQLSAVFVSFALDVPIISSRSGVIGEPTLTQGPNDTWYLDFFVNSGSYSSLGFLIYPSSTNQAGNAVYVWGASASLASQSSLPYQRVTTPTDYDAVGFPKYLRLDGTDDFYTCGGGGSTTGFYYSDVIRPMGGAGTRRVIWSDRSGNNGYELAINTANKLEFSAGNGTTITTVETTQLAALAEGKRYEVMDDGTNLSVQIDGSAAVTIARPVVTAGSPTITLYRGASAGYFNGQATEPIYRAGPPPSASERATIMGYQKQKAGL